MTWCTYHGTENVIKSPTRRIQQCVVVSVDALFARGLSRWGVGSMDDFCHRLFSRVLYQ